ncbi:unnamed protein product [Blepharisma stoltei]|uniref:Uncharacterized protein n=1 Tax=Blepharisma stoltei TaxID=1481888 RepID=A0AAU9JPS1_9CILI|nr:unnamed protein product [Blepharisma stoltei]
MPSMLLALLSVIYWVRYMTSIAWTSERLFAKIPGMQNLMNSQPNSLIKTLLKLGCGFLDSISHAFSKRKRDSSNLIRFGTSTKFWGKGLFLFQK